MSLDPGTRLGSYEITGKLGEGGMGEVYRARDAKLDRDVALKILPEDVADDPERLARLRREAKVLAALNHPNIAAIYGLEDGSPSTRSQSEGRREQGGGSTGPGPVTLALVLELVEGSTLADRIGGGPIPLDEALPIAAQIAEALEAAHDQGIVHRDLKPANVKVTPDGVVKVLDFGLARALDGQAGGKRGQDPAESPTVTMSAAATRVGMLMGTAAYMSPEQAKGKPADRRADLWAFGAVLFEMLSGRRAFVGDDASETLVAVLRDEPEWAALPSSTPVGVLRLLRRCLARDPRRRVQHAGDARIEIEDAAVESTARAPGSRAPRGIARPVMGAAVAAFVLGGLVTWNVGRGDVPSARGPTRFTVPLSDTATSLGFQFAPSLAPSPDGSALVINREDGGLLRREMSGLEARFLAGTEEGKHPFFSPDGDWIGFVTGVTGRNMDTAALFKIPSTGGVPVRLCGVVLPFRGASWNPDGTIVFAHEGGIFRVPDSGGAPELLVEDDDRRVTSGPQMLPGGDRLLFAQSNVGGFFDEEAEVVVRSLGSGETAVVTQGMSARWLPTGHLIYQQDDTLFAAPFDLASGRLSGSAVVVVEGIFSSRLRGDSQWAVGSGGTLAYVSGRGTIGLRNVVWIDREGTEEPLGTEPDTYVKIGVSPDGSRLAFDTGLDRSSDVWIYEIARGVRSRLTFSESRDGYPVWSPDGTSVFFGSMRDGEGGGIFRKAADGTGTAERLVGPDDLPALPRVLRQFPLPESISPDGRHLIVAHGGPSVGGWDVYSLTLDGTPELTPLVQTMHDERRPDVSPDGRWLAYQSNETGRMEIFVRPFPDVDAGKWQASPGGGTSPVWAPDGQALIYRRGQLLMAADVDATGASFSMSVPQPFYDGEGRLSIEANPRSHAMAPDGRLAVIVRARGAEQSAIVVVRDWLSELAARVPVE